MQNCILFLQCATFLPYFFLASATDLSTLNLRKNSCYKYDDYPLYPYSDDCFESPWVLSDTPNLIKRNGYKSEAHDVTTDDGYILTIFHVFSDNSKEKQPVYIQHGIAADSSTWVQNGMDSLAFFLIEKGYDVWLGNTRTTQYGKKHVSLSSKDSKFWNFTLDELASYDVRGNLKHVAKITKKPGEILYIGHSMGVTLSLMYAVDYPDDYLLKGIIALSPVVYFKPTSSVLSLSVVLYNVATIAKSLGINSVFYNSQITHQIWQTICKARPNFCVDVVNKLLGPSNLFLPEELTTYFSYFPDTIATNQILHFVDFMLSGNFQKFDYGVEENLKKYNKKTPPLYNLRIVKLPVFLFYGNNDAAVKKEKVERVFNELGSDMKDVQAVPINDKEGKYQFGHIQFLIGANLTALFYNDLHKYLQKLG